MLVSDLNTRLNTMKANDQLFEELGGDSEVLVYNAEDIAILAYRSFVLQKLFSMFVPRVHTAADGTKKLRFASRNLAVLMTLEGALAAVGQSTTGLTDVYDQTNIAANNAILAPLYLQIFLGT